MSSEPIAVEVVEAPELHAVVVQSQLEAESARSLELAFSPLFAEAKKWRDQCAAIKVTDVSQTREMKLARESRLALREIRIKADKRRKELKEDSLRRGKAIDGCYNVLAYLIEPLEKDLLDKEQFAERKEQERKAALKLAREQSLAPYSVNTSLYQLAEMDEPTFAELLNGTRLAHEAKIEAARKAEADRIAKEKADAEERERIRQENDRLKAEAAAKAEALRIEREKAEAARKEAEAKAKAERDALEAAARKEREEAARLAKIAADKARAEREAIEAKAKAEREAAEARAKKEREAREKAEAELRAAREAEAAKQAEEEAARKKAAAAPDRDKLMRFAYHLRNGLDIPNLTTEDGKSVRGEICAQVEKFAAWIEKKAGAL